MHFSALLAAAAALCATSASAKCFQSGQNWGNHDTAKSALRDACNDLAGSYGRGQTKTQCRNGDHHSYVFQVQNTGSATSGVSADECYRNIAAQIDNCGHGGEINHSGTRFRGDPNSGSC